MKTPLAAAALLAMAPYALGAPVTTSFEGSLDWTPRFLEAAAPLHGFYTINGEDVTFAHLTIGGFSSNGHGGLLGSKVTIDFDLPPNISPDPALRLSWMDFTGERFILKIHNSLSADYWLTGKVRLSTVPEPGTDVLLLLAMLLILLILSRKDFK